MTSWSGDMYGPSWPGGGQHDAHGAYDPSPTWSVEGTPTLWSWDGSLTLPSEPALSGSTLVGQSPVQARVQEHDRLRAAMYLGLPSPFPSSDRLGTMGGYSLWLPEPEDPVTLRSRLAARELDYQLPTHDPPEIDFTRVRISSGMIRGQPVVCSVEDVTVLQGEAMRDLIAAVKNRHEPGLPVNQEDIIAFLYVVFKDGWTSLLPYSAPDEYPDPGDPMDLAIEIGHLKEDQPFPGLPSTRRPRSASPPSGAAAPSREKRRAGDPIYIRARLSDTGVAGARCLSFGFMDGDSRWLQATGASFAYNEGYHLNRAYCEAMLAWDSHQWGRVTAYNLDWAVFFARGRFAYWAAWGEDRNCMIPPDECLEGVFQDLQLTRDQTQYAPLQVANALAIHQLTPPPDFLPAWARLCQQDRYQQQSSSFGAGEARLAHGAAESYGSVFSVEIPVMRGRSGLPPALV